MTSYYVFNDTRYHLTNEPFPFNLFPTLFNPLEKKYGGSYQSVRGVLEKLKYTILHCSSICFFSFRLLQLYTRIFFSRQQTQCSSKLLSADISLIKVATQ